MVQPIAKSEEAPSAPINGPWCARPATLWAVAATPFKRMGGHL
jgi:hypothetical protein